MHRLSVVNQRCRELRLSFRLDRQWLPPDPEYPGLRRALREVEALVMDERLPLLHGQFHRDPPGRKRVIVHVKAAVDRLFVIEAAIVFGGDDRCRLKRLGHNGKSGIRPIPRFFLRQQAVVDRQRISRDHLRFHAGEISVERRREDHVPLGHRPHEVVGEIKRRYT
ncbi:hypothetical protein D3C74_277490 [compost metagenome]